jgi:hypothetical protein
VAVPQAGKLQRSLHLRGIDTKYLYFYCGVATFDCTCNHLILQALPAPVLHLHSTASVGFTTASVGFTTASVGFTLQWGACSVSAATTASVGFREHSAGGSRAGQPLTSSSSRAGWCDDDAAGCPEQPR